MAPQRINRVGFFGPFGTFTEQAVRTQADLGASELVDYPTVPDVLDRCRALGLDIDAATVTFFLGRETLLATDRPGMALWRERLFALLSRNAWRATRFFRLPPGRVCELGAQIEL